MGTEAIGECSIKVKSDLIDVGFPKRQSYAMMSEGKVSCKVVVSSECRFKFHDLAFMLKTKGKQRNNCGNL